MKTGLIDRNNIELHIGDTYKHYKYDDVFTVFWKNGAICGGKTFEKCIPLGWDVDEINNEGDYEIYPDDNLDWLEIITINED